MGDRADTDDGEIGPLDTTEPLLDVDKMWWLCPGWNRVVVFGMLIAIGAVVATSSSLGARRTPGATCLTRVWAGCEKPALIGSASLPTLSPTTRDSVGTGLAMPPEWVERVTSRECTGGRTARAEVATKTAGGFDASGRLTGIFVLEIVVEGDYASAWNAGKVTRACRHWQRSVGPSGGPDLSMMMSAMTSLGEEDGVPRSLQDGRESRRLRATGLAGSC